MVRILSRSFALVFATVLVAGAGWTLSRPYLTDFSGRFGPTISCVCIAPMFDDTADWQRLAAATFALSAPDETVLHQASPYDGVIVDRRFTLTYDVGNRVVGNGLAKAGQDYREEAVTVGGRPGVMRSALFPDRTEPYFLQLVVPHVVQAKDGRWLDLEIHGWMGTYERWQLAMRVVLTVDFTPPYDVPLTPVHPRAAPPVIEIETP